MKKFTLLWTAFLLTLLSVSLSAQTTAVTGQVIDSDSQTWNNATWTAKIIVPGGGNPTYIGGGAVPRAFNGQLDGSGNFVSSSLPDNTKIVPFGTKWKFDVCTVTSAACQSFQSITISGASQNVGSYLAAQSIAPRITAATLVYAYNAAEILNPVSGSGYVNTVTTTQYVWNGAWTALSGGSATTPGGNDSQMQFNHLGVFTGSTITTDTSGNLKTHASVSNGANNWITNFSGNNYLFKRGATNSTISGTSPGGIYANYSYHGYDTCNSTYPGWNGNGASFNFSCDYRLYNNYSSGISNAIGMVINNFRDGDINVVRSYTYGSLARLTGGEEGWVGFGAYLNTGIRNMVGTISSIFSNATSLTIQCSNTSNCDTAAVMKPIVDTTTAVSGLSISAVTNTGSIPVVTISGGNVTASNCSTIAADVVTPTTAKDSPVSMNVQLSGVTTAYQVGQYVTLAKPGWENAKILAIPSPLNSGNQTITVGLILQYQNGGLVCSGGPAGELLDEVTYSSVAGQPYAFYVVGAASSNSLYVVNRDQTGTNAYNLIAGPITLYQGSLITGSGNACTFANVGTGEPNDACLYRASQTGSLTVSVMQNPFIFNSGDTMLNINTASAGAFGTRVLFSDPNPFLQSIGHEVFLPQTTSNQDTPSTMGGGAGLFVHTAYRPPTPSNGGPVNAAIFGQGFGQFGAGIYFDRYFGGDYSYNGAMLGGCMGLCFAPGSQFPPGSSNPHQYFLWDNSAGVIAWYDPLVKSLTYAGLTGGILYNNNLTLGNSYSISSPVVNADQLYPKSGAGSGNIGNGSNMFGSMYAYYGYYYAMNPLNDAGGNTLGEASHPWETIYGTDIYSGGNHVCTTAGGAGCTTTISNQTCNTNGCYVTVGNTLYMWGQVTGPSGGTQTQTVTFPTSFTSTTNLTVNVSCTVVNNCLTTVASASTSSFSAQFAPVVIVGGSGGNLNGSELLNWFAIGH